MAAPGVSSALLVVRRPSNAKFQRGKNRRINEVQPVRPGKAKLQALTKQANQHSKEDWENAFNAISDWVAITDLKGRILRTNTIAEKFTGVALSEIVGQSCCKLVHGSQKPIPGCPCKRCSTLVSARPQNFKCRAATAGCWSPLTRWWIRRESLSVQCT